MQRSFSQATMGSQSSVRAHTSSPTSPKDLKDVGIQCLQGFLKHITERFGTIVAAWRTVLDTDGNGSLSFGEFCTALRSLAFSGDLKQLWKELDINDSGVISLDELDPDANDELILFREYLVEHFGGLEAAWHQAFATQGRVRIELDQFEQRCSDIGYEEISPGRFKYLFKLLLPEKAVKHIVLKDFEPLLISAPTCDKKTIWYGALEQGESLGRRASDISDKFLVSKMEKKNQQEENAKLKERKQKEKETKIENRRIKEEERRKEDEAWEAKKKEKQKALHRSWTGRDGQLEFDEKDVGVKSLQSFKDHLIAHYGTSVAAWRGALDADGNGRVSFNELCAALRSVSFHGDMNKLWKELDSDNSGLISFDELDPEASAALREFREYIVDRFGGLEVAWRKGFDLQRRVRIDMDMFVERCAAIGYETDNPNQLQCLFKLLLTDKTVRNIVVKDFEALLIGVSTRDKKELWHGKPAQVQSIRASTAPAAAAAKEIMSKTASTTRCRALDALSEGSIHKQSCMSVSSSVVAMPKWSLRERSQELTQLIVPGPGAYDPLNVNKDKFDVCPQYSITSTCELSENPMPRNVPPGPGEYNAKTLPHGFRVQFGTTQRPKHRCPLTPGPGSYVMKGGIGDIASSSRSGFSFPRQHSQDGLHPQSTPSPAVYNPSHKETTKQPWDIAFRARLTTPLRKTPGPGDYEFLPSVGGSAVHKTQPKYTLHDRTKFSGRSRTGSALSPGFPHTFKNTVRSTEFISAETVFRK